MVLHWSEGGAVHVAVPLTFLTQPVWVSVVQRGALSPPLCSRIFSVVSFP